MKGCVIKMTYKFCLVPIEEVKKGNVGRTYAYQHRSEWIDGSWVEPYLGAGYVKGVDHAVHNGKSYALMKTLIDLDAKVAVFVCAESVAGCDT